MQNDTLQVGLASSPACKICNAQSRTAFRTEILEKYQATYYRCESCGFVQTEEPYWLAESYASAINDIDLGPVNRAVVSSRLVEGLILSLFDRDAKFVDYGAGYGVLVRLMRDRGFDFYWNDLYCENLFAKHFVAEPNTKFELLTAFEVFEHLVDPLSEIKTMLDFSENILFSTLLVPQGVQVASDWWYFAPEHGQHVSFYTTNALEHIGETFDLHLSSDGLGTHLLSRHPVSSHLFKFFVRNSLYAKLVRTLLRRRMKRKSLLIDDFRSVSGHSI